MMGVAHLRVVGLSVALGSTKVVDDASLIVDSGEWLTVTGPSGAGKSVLLQAMAGLLPSTGQVLVDGRPLRVHGEDSPGVVMQGYALLPLLTAFENVSLPLQARKARRAEIQAKVGRALEDLGLTPTASQLVSTLSGGQRQRVAIARALAPEPSVLLLDEPTAELDPDNRAKVLRLLRRHAERGAAVVVVTHDPATIEAADAVIELQPGGRLAGAA